MQQLELKRVLIAAIPLILVALLVTAFNHAVKTYIRCEGGDCAPVAHNLNNILAPDDSTTREPAPNDTSEDQRKKKLKTHERSAAIYSGRITWVFFRLAYIIICLTALAVACGVTYNSFADEGKLAIISVLAVVALSVALSRHLLNHPEKYMSVFAPLFEMTIEKDLRNIAESMIQVNSFGFAVVLSVVLATCAILYSPINKTYPAGLKQLSTKMNYLQLILYVGTVMLIVGVLLIRCMYQWSLAFMLRDEQALKIAESFFSNLLAAEGGFFTLILASVYLPAALILRRRADSLICLAGENPDKEKLLKDYNLTFSFAESLPKIIAILSPLLAGPVGELFGRLSK